MEHQWRQAQIFYPDIIIIMILFENRLMCLWPHFFFSLALPNGGLFDILYSKGLKSPYCGQGLSSRQTNNPFLQDEPLSVESDRYVFIYEGYSSQIGPLSVGSLVRGLIFSVATGSIKACLNCRKSLESLCVGEAIL